MQTKYWPPTHRYSFSSQPYAWRGRSLNSLKVSLFISYYNTIIKKYAKNCETINISSSYTYRSFLYFKTPLIIFLICAFQQLLLKTKHNIYQLSTWWYDPSQGLSLSLNPDANRSFLFCSFPRSIHKGCFRNRTFLKKRGSCHV